MKFLAITTALVLCILSTASVAADGTEGSAWGYKRNDPSMASPEQWSEHYPTCGGSKQSPIDIEVSAGRNGEPRMLTFSGDCTDYNLTQSSESFKATVNSSSYNYPVTTIFALSNISLLHQVPVRCRRTTRRTTCCNFICTLPRNTP
ncbi:hypothetical protein PC116_g18581 [Phytophthora cactorum]|nr:hypothetical protein PC116_g18581 [Phytophthora cactorum]